MQKSHTYDQGKYSLRYNNLILEGQDGNKKVEKEKLRCECVPVVCTPLFQLRDAEIQEDRSKSQDEPEIRRCLMKSLFPTLDDDGCQNYPERKHEDDQIQNVCDVEY